MAFKLGENLPLVLFTLLLLNCGVPFASASVPSRVVNRFVSNALSVLMRWLGVSFRNIFRTAIFRHQSVNYEDGYDVETVFDGSKYGVEPYAVGISPAGEILVLDSSNSNLYKISTSMSMFSRPTLVAGSSGGYSGYVDGRLRQAMMNHPKGVTVDDRGNIYVADTDNLAIRKISDNGVSTIAGGKHSRVLWRGHMDGPSEDATFSNDFDVVYSRSTCSLLVVDRGNKAIRQIQLHLDDCPFSPYLYWSNFPCSIAMVIASVLFGYILALLQSRIVSILFPQPEKEPLIPPNEDQLQHKKHKKHSKTRHAQETLLIPNTEGPPPFVETQDPTPRRTHTMSRDQEKRQRLSDRYAFYKGWWDQDFARKLLHRHQNRARAPAPLTYYQANSGTAHEIVFGAVQEHDKWTRPVNRD